MAPLQNRHPILKRPAYLAMVLGWYAFFVLVFLVGLFHTETGPSTLMLVDLLAGSACFWLVGAASTPVLYVGIICFVHAVLISLSGILDSGSFGSCVHTAASLTAIFCTACSGLLILVVLRLHPPGAISLPVYEAHKKTDEETPGATLHALYPRDYRLSGSTVQAVFGDD